MPYTADQAEAVKSTIATLRPNATKHAQDFFIFYMKKCPGDLNKFPNYKGKAIDSLPSVPQFSGHVTAVLTEALVLFEIAHDAGALAARGKAQVASHVPRNVGSTEFGNLLGALTEFLKQELGGSFDAAAWGNATTQVLAALK